MAASTRRADHRDLEEGFMKRRQGDQLSATERIAAFAEATEAYAESLEDPDLANVYWGKSLGLWQALVILSADEPSVPGNRLRGPEPNCGPRRAYSPSASTRPVGP
jgi:hypothetical protein